VELSFLEKIEEQIEQIVESFYAKFPSEMKEEYDQRKSKAPLKPGPITIRAQVFIDDRFKKGGDGGGENPS
jgi:hypothetical protein